MGEYADVASALRTYDIGLWARAESHRPGQLGGRSHGFLQTVR